MPCDSSQLSDSPRGALPDPFSAIGVVLSLGAYRQKQSPPTLVIAGSTTQCTATAAIAASTAFPPRLKISSAAEVASAKTAFGADRSKGTGSPRWRRRRRGLCGTEKSVTRRKGESASTAIRGQSAGLLPPLLLFLLLIQDGLARLTSAGEGTRRDPKDLPDDSAEPDDLKDPPGMLGAAVLSHARPNHESAELDPQ